MCFTEGLENTSFNQKLSDIFVKKRVNKCTGEKSLRVQFLKRHRPIKNN